jgi:antitoxin YefM
VIRAIKQKGIVGREGKIEINSTELEEGTDVDIIILVSDTEPDTTEYLLSTKANRRELSEAIERIENKENLVTITAQEWHEKYSI